MRNPLLGAGLFSFLAFTGPRAAAQETPPKVIGVACPTFSCDIQNDWMRNNVLLYITADAMPEAKFSFKPTPEQQTFGERVMHVVGINMEILRALGGTTPPPSINMSAKSKSEILAAVKQSGEYGAALLKEFSEPQLLERVNSPPLMGPKASRQRLVYFLMTHSQETYGQLVVYLRLNGVTPPVSRQP